MSPVRAIRAALFVVLLACAVIVGFVGCGTEESHSTLARGKTLYEIACGACHKPDGRGAPGVGPPLAGSSWVTGPEEVLVLIALDGVRGPVKVQGRAHNLEMPALRHVFTDEELAAVLTYIRGAWENTASPVSRKSVAALRAATAARGDSWTIEELRTLDGLDPITPGQTSRHDRERR